MRIVEFQDQPFHCLRYANVSKSRAVVTERLPFFRAEVDGLPDGLDAIIATADLQGRELAKDYDRPTRLLGEMLADEIDSLRSLKKVPPRERMAIIVAGDLFVHPQMHRRGGLGDVRSVWLALARVGRWIAGVAGNHDVFNSSHPPDPLVLDRNFVNKPGVHLLDGTIIKIDGLRIAGLSGIVGDPRRPFHRHEQDFADAMGRLASAGSDLIITHDGPDVENTTLPGWASARRALEASRPTLVVRGHRHWDTPLAVLANGTQVLNVHARVVVVHR